MSTVNLTPHGLQQVAAWTRLFALGAIVGPALFTLAWVVLGFLSPGYMLFDTVIAPYSAIHQPISGLGLGDTGSVMNAAFVIGGLMLMAGVVGVFGTLHEYGNRGAGRVAAVLLLLSPLGMIMAGVFTLEAVLPHLIGFLLAVATPVLSFLVAGTYFRRIPRWRVFGTWLLGGSGMTLILVVTFFATFDPIMSGNGEGIAGITQRLLSVEVHGWFVAMGWLAVRRPLETAASVPAVQ